MGHGPQFKIWSFLCVSVALIGTRALADETPQTEAQAFLAKPVKLPGGTREMALKVLLAPIMVPLYAAKGPDQKEITSP
jgi:hypothetical protein